jgi:hypothetical protein
MAHIYFRQTDASRMLGNRNAKNPEGGEFFSLRQHNRYVVGPGSTHPNGNMYTVAQNPGCIADFPDWLEGWIASYSEPEKAKAKGKAEPKLHDDFDFDAFCEHYGIDIHGDGPWYRTAECPYAGRAHEQSKDTGLFYDGEMLGFHCFAGGCGDPSIGDLLRKLNESHERYPGVIWVEEDAMKGFGVEADDALPAEDRFAMHYRGAKGDIYSNDGKIWYDEEGNRL